MTATVWGDVAADAARKLAEASVADAPMQARRLVEQASGYEGGEYYVGLTKAATQRQMAYFDEMLAQRLAGTPLQYVLGRWGFRGLDLMVSPAVLIPRPETETLAGLAIAELARRDPPGGVAVDLGTGSGAVGLAVAAECEAARLVLTDVSAEALAVARANLAGLGRAAVRVSVGEGSWYEALPESLAGTGGRGGEQPPVRLRRRAAASRCGRLGARAGPAGRPRRAGRRSSDSGQRRPLAAPRRVGAAGSCRPTRWALPLTSPERAGWR